MSSSAVRPSSFAVRALRHHPRQIYRRAGSTSRGESPEPRTRRRTRRTGRAVPLSALFEPLSPALPTLPVPDAIVEVGGRHRHRIIDGGERLNHRARVRRIVAADLDHVSLIESPTYQDAAVLAVG